jgi:RND family efflux transporter MFP subunit
MNSMAARSGALLLIAIGSSSCGRHEPAHTNLPTPVRVRPVAQQQAQSSSRFSAVVEPATRVDLAFRIGGYVDSLAAQRSVEGKRPIEEGDWVKKGTVLARVRAADYSHRAAAAKASAAEAIAAKKLAEQELERTSRLVASQTSTRAELDVKAARLDAARAQVDGANARVGEATATLADTVLKAPMDGVVLKRNVEVGTLASPGAVAFVIADTRSVRVTFGAPEALVDKLQVGAPLRITSPSAGGVIDGKVTRIAPSADLQGRVFSVESRIDNPEGLLKPGMIASITIPEGAAPGEVLVLPLTSVVRSPRDPRGFSVFVVSDGAGRPVARARDVECGDVLGNTVVITKGLALGERAVSMGATLLHDGDAVSIIP